MTRDCTNCGKQWDGHTGTYCEDCGEPKPTKTTEATKCQED